MEYKQIRRPEIGVADEYDEQTNGHRRKSYQYEHREMAKNLEENRNKITPSVDEYLDRSQSKYLIWRERERERMDRRYRSLHRSYMNEFQQLGFDDNAFLQSIYKRRPSEPDVPYNAEEISVPDVVTSLKANNVVLAEDGLSDLKDLNIKVRGRSFSAADIRMKYFERRASAGSTKYESATPRRRISTSSLSNDRCLPLLPLGKRLDRRPTLQNIAIPLNYGN